MKRMLVAILAVALPVSIGFAASDAQPYAGLQSRGIKALSPERIDGLLSGKGLSYALAAELNGLPGPRHVLDLADRLGLDATTKAQVEAIFARMNSAARGLGTELIEAEARLEKAFVSGKADATEIERLTAEIAAIEGRLRSVHLVAHLETEPLLTQHQKHVYAAERGYAGRPAESHGGHGQQHQD
jgi:hypothetical protein